MEPGCQAADSFTPVPEHSFSVVQAVWKGTASALPIYRFFNTSVRVDGQGELQDWPEILF